MAKFPRRLFVKIIKDNDTQYWQAEEDCEALAGEVGGQEDVAIYEYTGRGKLATKAEFVSDKRRAAKRK